MKAYRRREGLLGILALVLLLAAGVFTQNPLINLLFLLTVGCSIFAALVWFYWQDPRDGVDEAADTNKVKKIGMVLSNAAMLVAVVFVGSILPFIVAGIAMVGFCVVAWPACRVLFEPD